VHLFLGNAGFLANGRLGRRLLFVRCASLARSLLCVPKTISEFMER
jgi:hypothetical protein